MRLAMTLLVRDEADIVDAQISFHLHAGVDLVIATDNGSRDGTTEILERHASQGHLRLLHEDGGDMRQGEWVSRMARLAATEHDADWVLNTDADEFWWPRTGSLKDVLTAVPDRFGVVRGCWRHFVPRPDDGSFFAERMLARLTRPAHPGDKRTVYHAHQKVAHRARPDVRVEFGNHNAEGDGLEPLRGWLPIEVLHFSFRSVAQTKRKLAGGWLRNASYDAPQHQLLAEEARLRAREAEYYAEQAFDDAALEAGLAEGALEIDTRLRDALRAIRADDGTFTFPEPGTAPILTFPRPTASQDAALAAEIAPLHEIDAIVRAERRVAELEAAIDRLAHEPRGRLAAKLGGDRSLRHRLAPR